MADKKRRVGHQTVVEDLRLATKTADFYRLALEGKSIPEIAAEYGLTEDYVRAALSKISRQITERSLELKEEYVSLTMARTERLFGMVMGTLERQVEKDRETDAAVGPDPKLVKLALSIMSFQQDIVAPKTPNAPVVDARSVIVNQTMTTRTPLYDEALADMQFQVLGEAVHKAPQGAFINDERLLKLEQMAQSIPQGLILEEDDDV